MLPGNQSQARSKDFSARPVHTEGDHTLFVAVLGRQAHTDNSVDQLDLDS